MFRDNDRVKLVVMLDGDAQPPSARKLSGKASQILKRKHLSSSSSSSSSDDSSDSDSDTCSRDSISVKGKRANKRTQPVPSIQPTQPSATKAGNKGQAKKTPPVPSQAQGLLQVNSVHGSGSLNAHTVWQQMVQQQQQHTSGAPHAPVPGPGNKTTLQGEIARAADNVPSDVPVSTPGSSKKKKKPKKKKAKTSTDTTNNVEKAEETLAVVVTEKEQVDIPMKTYVPVASATKLVPGDVIRYRQPVLHENGVPGLSDAIEVTTSLSLSTHFF